VTGSQHTIVVTSVSSPYPSLSAYVSGPDDLTPTTYISRAKPQSIVALNFWTTSPAGPLKAAILSVTQQIKSHNRPKSTIWPQWNAPCKQAKGEPVTFRVFKPDLPKPELLKFDGNPMRYCGSPLLKKKTTTHLGQFRKSTGP